VYNNKNVNVLNDLTPIEKELNPLADTMNLLKKEIPKIKSSSRLPTFSTISDSLESKMQRLSFDENPTN